MRILDRLLGRHRQKRRERELERELERNRHKLSMLKVRLAQKQYEIEQEIHSLKPASTRESFVPPFPTWLQMQQDEELHIEDALDRYIQEYDLLRPTQPSEPVELSRIVARLKILEISKDTFSSDVQEDLNKYIFALNCSLMIHRNKWEVQQKRDSLEKGKDGGA
jgi:predicted RNase H-like nuclease (RuvC/YqgF family)